MQPHKMILACVASALLFACSDSVFSALDRTAADPSMEKPTVDSLKTETAIPVSWQSDPGADSYKLYRDTDPNGSFSQLLYAGDGTSYLDASVTQDRMYYYRLAKVRGKKEFEKSDYVPGVTSAITKDSLDNHDMGSAAEVTYAIQSTIYFYRDGDGNEIGASNWYYMIVPPRSYITVEVTGFQNTASDELDFQAEGELGSLLSTGATAGERTLTNYSTSAARVSFQVYVDKDAFVGIAGAPGGKSASYVVQYLQTNAL